MAMSSREEAGRRRHGARGGGGKWLLAAAALWPIVMRAQTYPSHEAVSVLSDGRFAEMYVTAVDPQTREIASMQFYEPRPDLGGAEFLKKVNWEARVPEGAQPFIATSGRLQGELNAFWLGWRDAKSFNALSVYQEAPIRAALHEEDQVIWQPIITAEKRLYCYLWR